MVLWLYYGFYIHKDLKYEYLMIENPRELWIYFKQRYEQQKELIWPRTIINEIIYISNILNLWHPIIMLFIGFALS
jgi:hypothetical protein